MPEITQSVNYKPLQSEQPPAPYRFDAQPKIDTLDGKKFRSLHNVNSEGQYTAIHSSKFQRVHPTQEEFSGKIGADYQNLVNIESTNDVQTARLRPNDGEDSQSSRTGSSIRGAKDAAESNEREFHEAFRSEMSTEAAPATRGFFSKILAMMTGDNEKLILSKEADNTVGIKTNTSQAAGDSLEVQPLPDDIKDKSKGKKIAYGIGLGLLGVGLVATGVGLPMLFGAAGLVVGVGALGGVLGLGVLAKFCSSIKAPWWAGTVDGQRQWAERKAAVDVGNGIENMVYNQVLKGTRDKEVNPLNPGDQSQWESPELCQPETVVGWMKLAKHNSPDELKAKIRAELLDPAKSFLHPQTIKDAKRGAMTGWWFTGNPKGHAEKTVNMVAEEIYRGVIRGLASGTMSLVEAELADAKSQAAQDALKPWLSKTSDDFKSALNRFAPAQEANQPDAGALESRAFEFYETDQALAKVASYESQADAVQSQLDEKKAVIGEANHTVYSEVLKSFSHDLEAYKSSLGVVDRIVHGKNAAEGEPSIKGVNTGLGEILDTHLNPSEGAGSVDAIVDRLKSNLVAISNDLASEVAENKESPDLLKQHHDGMAALVAKYDGAINSVATFAKTLGSAEQSLKEGNLDRGKINDQALQLRGLEKLNGDDACPLKNDAPVLAKIARADENRGRMLGDIENIQTAYVQLEKLKDSGIALAGAAKTNLRQALASDDFKSLGHSKESIQQGLKTWKEAGYNKPSDLNPENEYASIKRQMVAGALGLPDDGDLAGMAFPLGALCEEVRTEIVGALKDLGPDRTAPLLAELHTIHSSNASAAVKAAKSMEAAGKVGLSSLSAGNLAKTLYPEAMQAVESYRQFTAVLSKIETARSQMAEPLVLWAKLETIQPRDISTRAGFISLLGKALQKLDATLDDIKAVGDLKTHVDRFGEGGLADQAEQIAEIDSNTLQRLEKFTTTISGGAISQKIIAATNRLEAHARALANAVGGDQGLQEAAKSNDNAQLEVVAGVIGQNLEFQKSVQIDLKRASLNADEAANALHGLIGARISPAAISKRLAENKEISQLLQLGIQSQQALAGAGDIPGLAHEFSAQELTDGLRLLGKCPIVPVAGATHLSKSEEKHLAKRNQAIESIKKQMNGIDSADPAKAEKILSKLVTKHRLEIEAFLHEERAYQALQSLYSAGTVTTAQLRGLFEKHSKDFLQTRLVLNRNLGMNELVSDPNMQALDQAHLGNLKPRIETLAALKDAQNPPSIWKDSAYLQGVEARLADLRGEGRSQAAFQNAAEGGLVELGKRLHEGDAGKAIAPEALRLVYLKGQSEAVKRGLKYLNPKNMENARPGIFRRAYNKIFQPDTKYEKLMAAADLNSLGESIKNLSHNDALKSYLSDTFVDLKSQQETLVEKRNALVGDAKKVETGLRMVAIGHLSHLACSSENPSLTEQDFTQIVDTWKTKLGDSKEAFADLVARARESLVGKSISELEEALDPQARADFEKELSALEAQERDVARAHALLKSKFDAATDLVTFKEMTRADFRDSRLFVKDRDDQKLPTWMAKGQVSILPQDKVTDILLKMQASVDKENLKGYLADLANQFTGVEAIHGLLISGLQDDTLELEELDGALRETRAMIADKKASSANVFRAIEAMPSISSFGNTSESLRERLTKGYSGEPSALDVMRTRLNSDFAKLENLQEKLQELVNKAADDIEADTGSQLEDEDQISQRQKGIQYITQQLGDMEGLAGMLSRLSSEDLTNFQTQALNAMNLPEKSVLLAAIQAKAGEPSVQAAQVPARQPDANSVQAAPNQSVAQAQVPQNIPSGASPNERVYQQPGVDVIRNRLNSLNNTFGTEKLSQDQLDQLTSILSSDQALEDYQELIVSLEDKPQELKQVFTQLIDAQAAKEASFSIAPRSFSPLFGNQKSSKSLKSLNQLVTDLGLTRKNSNGDGNCFFHSVAMQVGGGQQGVRNGIAQKMEDLVKLPSGQRGSEALTNEILSQVAIDRTKTNAVGKPNQQDFWGENYHAIIASKVYNRPVVVVSPLELIVIKPDGSAQETNAQLLQQLKSERPIVLLYNGSNHWDAGEIQ